MTTQEISDSQSILAELADIVKRPAFKLATEAILIEAITPSDNLGLTTPDVGNGRYQQLVGMRHAFTRLTNLAHGRFEVKKLSEPRLFTEADRELLKQRNDEANA